MTLDFYFTLSVLFLGVVRQKYGLSLSDLNISSFLVDLYLFINYVLLDVRIECV